MLYIFWTYSLLTPKGIRNRNMNCIYIRIKINHKLECKKLHKIIIHKDCANCVYKEYKIHNKSTNTMQKPVKSGLSAKKLQSSAKVAKKWQKSSKLRKLEKNRTSLFTNDLNHCYICNKPKDHLHEVIFGKNRINSMKYGLVIPVCNKCHRMIHNDSEIQLEHKKRGQALFNKAYPDLNFIDIFHENYLD